MPQSPDSSTAEDSAPTAPGETPSGDASPAVGLDAGEQAQDQDTTWFSVLKKPQFNVAMLLILALGMVPVGAGLAHLADPTLSWPTYMMQAIGTGWTGPLLVLLLLTLAKVIFTVRGRVLDRRLMHASSMIISLVASRTAHYEEVGVPEPAKAAAFDAAAFITEKVTSAQGGQWVGEALKWYVANVADAMPAPPARLRRKYDLFAASLARSNNAPSGDADD